MFTARSLWTRVKIGGAWVQVAGDVRISESVDQLSRVAEFALASQPATEPEIGDDVLIEWFDFTEGNVYAAFGGTINSLTVESQPFALTVIANDQLRLLDRVRQGTDLDLTGMTPKAALIEVLDDCGITYDPDDLADPVYTLGEQEPLAWLVDTPGSQITNELSTVFGCVLLTVGNDRVLWLSHDSTPADGTGSYATLTKGTTIDFAGHGRVHGERSRIQNNWIVRGVTAQISKSCTGTAWAKAVGTNPQLGRRRRTAEQTFQSDLIQSEDLAEAIVRRLMRETNRLPDERTTPLVNDPNIHPCSKLTIVDPTYGLGANPTYATVLAVDRQGSRMTLRLAAGPGGSEGTVTTGVDKVCNDTHTGLDWPGSGFDFPDFDFPPIDLGDLIDFDLDLDIPPLFTPGGIGGTDVPYSAIGGEPGGGGGGDCETPLAADWEVDSGSPSLDDGFVSAMSPASAHATGLPVPAGVPWELRATVQLGTGHSVEVGVGFTGLGGRFWALLYATDETFPGIEAGTLSDTTFDTHNFTGSSVPVVLTWNPDTEELTADFDGGLEILVASEPAPTSSTLYPYVRIYDTGTSPLTGSEVSDIELCFTGIGVVIPAPGEWTTELGSITYPDDGALSFAATPDAQASYDDTGAVFPLAAATRFRWFGHCDRTGTDEVLVGFWLMNAGSTVSAGIEWQFSAGGDLVNLYSFAGFESDDVGAIPDEFDFAIDWNPTAGTISLSIDGSPRGSASLGTWPGDDLFPKVSHGEAGTMALDLTGMYFVVGD
jgi:hypothetical protein